VYVSDNSSSVVRILLASYEFYDISYKIMYLISLVHKLWRKTKNYKSRSCDPSHAPFHHPLYSTRRDLSNKEKTVSSFTRSKVTERVLKFKKSRSRDPDYALF